MNGRGKSARLCLVFALAGVLTVMCLARTSVSIPPSVSHYLDIVMAVLMVVLLLCVLELCLGVELCAVSCCCCCTRRRTSRDPEGRDEDSSPSTPDPFEAPPSYEVIMAQGGAGTHAGAAAAGRGGRTKGRGREAEPLKRDLSVYFRRYISGDANGPPMRLSVSPGVSETSFVSASELWLSVDGLPSYEEAVARLREEEEEEVARFHEEEVVMRLREEAIARLQEEAMGRLREEAVARMQEGEVTRMQEGTMAQVQEGALARLQEEDETR